MAIEICAKHFRNSKDIHTATAAKVYNVDEEDVTKEMRYKAKSVNFGIIYGQGAFGLADNLGISQNRSKRRSLIIIKKNFPALQDTWMIRSILPGNMVMCKR